MSAILEFYSPNDIYMYLFHHTALDINYKIDDHDHGRPIENQMKNKT